MARPRKKVDEKLLQTLAYYNLSDYIMAQCLGVSVQTLNRRFGEKIESFRSSGKSKLAQKLWDQALNKDHFPAMKLLASVHLNWNEKTTISSEDQVKPFTLSYDPKSIKKAVKDE